MSEQQYAVIAAFVNKVAGARLQDAAGIFVPLAKGVRVTAGIFTSPDPAQLERLTKANCLIPIVPPSTAAPAVPVSHGPHGSGPAADGEGSGDDGGGSREDGSGEAGSGAGEGPGSPDLSGEGAGNGEGGPALADPDSGSGGAADGAAGADRGNRPKPASSTSRNPRRRVREGA